jgi:hypothetical protein
MALIQPVAEQPTFIGKLQALWDFTTVKLAILAALLGAIGLGIPAVRNVMDDQTFMNWLPVWFLHVCQFAGLLVTLGIVPARGTVQPNLPAKQAARANVPVDPQTPPSGG